MGYTHSYSVRKWSSPEWQAAWPKLIGDTSTIIKAAGIPLTRGCEDSRPPVASISEGISINRAGDDARENFILNKKERESFTKTLRRPYDLVVCCVLLRAYMLAPNQFSVDSSDGEWDEIGWVRARELYHNLWPNEPINCPLEPLEE